ncbi:MAG: hypothetical protein GX891_00975 [Clostridiales bacterium]|nr:hypothetical protein [Clostridiales bacterium]
MKRLKIIINHMCGNSERATKEKVLSKLGGEFNQIEVVNIKNSSDIVDVEGCDAIAVCGGDGTLNNAVHNACGKGVDIFYFPCGTLNELSKHMSKKGDPDRLLRETGVIKNRRFVYVAATGTFTPIGYTTTVKAKKKFKLLAYFFKVLSEYKVFHIKADIEADGKKFSDTYTLIMFIDSSRCFGFKFNKMFEPNDGRLHMLLIKSPKKRGLMSKIKIFFPMFKAFWIGFTKEYKSKNMVFMPVTEAKVKLEKPQPFCIDGERYYPDEEFTISVAPIQERIKVF